MTQTINNILNRTSTRCFLDKDVEEEKLNLVLQAGVSAPTAINKQSPIIICIKNDNLVERIREEGRKVRNGKDPFYGAKIFILVCADTLTVEPVKDGSCVLENMFIAAESLQLGTCWINCMKDIFKTDTGKIIQRELNITDNYLAIGTCIIGYPTESNQPKSHKKDYVRKFY